jgi:rubrerythrin
MNPNYSEKFNKTEEVMICKNCGHPVIQSEVDGNEGNCPNCDKKFQPFDVTQ